MPPINKKPQMKKRNPLSIFGSGARSQETRSPGFIDQRNQQLAGQFQQQGIKDMQGIEQNLMKSGSFSRANEADRKNTITNIYNLMQKGGGATGGPAIPPATASNPYRMVEMSSTGSDLNSLDLGGLEDELVKSRYKAMRGEGGADELVRINRIQRLIKEKSPGSAGSLDQSIPDTSELERKRDEFMANRTTQDSDALAKYRQQMEAQFANRRREVELAGQKERESAQGAMSTSGFGRSTVNAEMQGEIEKRTQNAILAEQQAKDLAIMAYQRQLEGATGEELDSYNQQIRQLQGQAEAIKMENAQRAMEMNQQSSGAYTEQLDSLMQAQAKSEAEKMKQQSTPSVDRGRIKVQRIGGTNKNPIYGYFDPVTGEIKQASGQMMQSMGYSGGGGGGVGGSRAGGGWGAMGAMTGQTGATQGSVYDQIMSMNPGGFKNIDQAKNYGFATNAILANEDIRNNQDYILSLSPAEQQALKLVPGFAEGLKPQQYKVQEQAEENFVKAVLRPESGAAIGEAEMAAYRRQYFPQPGDGPDVIRQKEKNRAVKIEGIIAASGKSDLLRPVAQQTYASSKRPNGQVGMTTPPAVPPTTPGGTSQTTTQTSTTTKSGVSKNKFKKLLK